MTIRHKNRQISDPAIPSNVAGVTNAAVTVGTDAAVTQTSLAIDTAVTPGSPASATGALAPGPSSKTTSSDRPSTATASTNASGVKSIPISTVLAVCIGAFIAVTLIVLLAIWIYKRTGKKTSRSRNYNHQLSQTRNVLGDSERSRSRQEHWGRLKEGTDTRYPPAQTREMDKDNLTSFSMFKKSSPSVRSIGSFANTTAESKFEFEPGSFPKYHPQVGGDFVAEPPTRDFLGRIEVVSPMSWGAETIGKESHLSSSSGGNAAKAIPTPTATSYSEPHRWESAEVEHCYEDYDYDDDNGGAREGRARSTRSGRSSLFEERRARRRSLENPFFGGGTRDKALSPSRSRSRSRSRTRSEKANVHGSANPFSDPDSPVPVPELPRHQSMNSRSTGSSFNSERALQSLIAALTPDHEQDALRIQSLQPSVLSVSPSAVSEDVDRTSVSAFPLPPTSLPP